MTIDYISYPSLTYKQRTEVINLVNLAKEDPELEGIDTVFKGLKIILSDNEVVGFFSPRQTSFKGKKYWRAGATYIAPNYRKKGIAKEALENFFSDKPGMVWISDTNTPSIALFTSIGFVKSGNRDDGHWYIRDNT